MSGRRGKTGHLEGDGRTRLGGPEPSASHVVICPVFQTMGVELAG